MRAAILGLLCAACGSAPPPSKSWPAPVSTAYRATDPFHVVVHAVEATGLNPMRFWLCPIEGATFLCGDDLYVVRGGRIERDPDLERGLPRDTGVMRVAGRWPDDAWLVTGGKESQSHVAYRWRDDRWSKVAALPDWDWSQPIAVWRGQLFVLQQPPVNPPKPPRLAVYAPGAISQLVRELVARTTCKDGQYSWHGALAASVSTLFVVEAGCGKMNRSLTRVTETGMTTVALPEATDLAVVASDRGAIIFGGTSQYEARVLGHVDAAWTPVDAPGAGQITSYARAPDGTEWIGVHNEPGDYRGKVYARAPGAIWQPVDWQSATAAYGTSPQFDHLWVAEGSVWITTFVDGACHDTKGCLYRSLLLRTGPAAPSLSLTPRMP